jgi:hypothetical protein
LITKEIVKRFSFKKEENTDGGQKLPKNRIPTSPFVSVTPQNGSVTKPHHTRAQGG